MMMTGSYGSVFTSDMLNLITTANGTAFAIPAAPLEIFVSLVLDGQRWATTPNGDWDWHVIGRGNSGPGEHSPPFGSDDLTELPSPRHNELIQYAAMLDGRPHNPLTGNRHFWDSDYMVHRRSKYMMSLHMYSNRTIASRCVNAQGKMNGHEADAVLNLHGAPHDSYPNPYLNVFPVWDWTRLAGMSYPHGLAMPPCKDADDYNSWPVLFPGLPFVAGASDGQYGTTASNISVGNGLVKQGSWFFGDDVAVHTSRVTCSEKNASGSTTTASTALAQHLLEPGDEVWVGGGSCGTPPSKLTMGNHTVGGDCWVFHARSHNGTRGTGYTLLTPSSPTGTTTSTTTLPDLSIEVGPRRGDWSALGTSTGIITRNVVGVWVDHPCESPSSTHANNGAVAFAILPTASLATMQSSVVSLSNVLANNDASVQAAQTDADAPRVHATFWTAGATSSGAAPGWRFTSSAPCAMLAQELGPTQLSVSLATPLATGPITITVDRTLRGPNCTSVGPDVTAMHFAAPPSDDYIGSTQTVTCGA
eukprot:m.46197 g.46197  ORF g.46197 m.46197 type:complete len:532 (+) comp6732_c0_seq1:1-1596(+)